MLKILFRFIALLLVPCLVGDPALATNLNFSLLTPSHSVMKPDNKNLFEEQALTQVTLWMQHALIQARQASYVWVLVAAAVVGVAIHSVATGQGSPQDVSVAGGLGWLFGGPKIPRRQPLLLLPYRHLNFEEMQEIDETIQSHRNTGYAVRINDLLKKYRFQ